MNNFRLIGIAHPGRVNVLKYGTVELANLSDEIALEIWKRGCKYLEPLPHYREVLFPEETPIRVKPILIPPPLPANMKPEKGTRKHTNK